MKKNSQKNFATSAPIEPTPTPSTSYYRIENWEYEEYFDYRVTNIEDKHISVERIDDTKVDYYNHMNRYEKERLFVDNRVLVFSNGTIIHLEKAAVDSEDLVGRYIEGDRMEYTDIKIGDIVDIIYLYQDFGSDSSKWSSGCRIINVKR